MELPGKYTLDDLAGVVEELLKKIADIDARLAAVEDEALP